MENKRRILKKLMLELFIPIRPSQIESDLERFSEIDLDMMLKKLYRIKEIQMHLNTKAVQKYPNDYETIMQVFDKAILDAEIHYIDVVENIQKEIDDTLDVLEKNMEKGIKNIEKKEMGTISTSHDYVLSKNHS